MAIAKINNHTNVIHWVPSIGTNNMCGFASFDLPIQKLLNSGYISSEDNSFLQQYMQALHVENTHTHGNAKVMRAAAIKRAFVDTMRADNSGDTPFDTIMELVAVEFLQPGQSDLQDYTDFIQPFIRNNDDEMRSLYVRYKEQIDAQAQYDDFNREHRYQEGTTFFNFLKLEAPEFVARAKEEYCAELIKPENIYRARDIDMLYIAKQINCFGKVSIHDHRGDMQAISEYRLLETSDLELHLKNTGNHWEAADLLLPMNPVLENQRENTPHQDIPQINTIGRKSVDSLLFVFGNLLESQPKLIQLLDVDNSEISKIAEQGDAFIARTMHANELLDNGDACSIRELNTMFDSVERLKSRL